MSEKRKILKCTMSFIMIVTLVLATGVYSFAASPHIQSNVSETAVSANLSDRSLPTAVSTLTSGNTYHFNLATDTSNKFKSASLYLKQAGESSYSNVYNYTAKNYFRYCDASIKATGSGTLYYYWSVKYADTGKTATFKTNSKTVVKPEDPSDDDSDNTSDSSSLIWPAESGYNITTLNWYWNNGSPKSHGTRWGWSHAIDISGGGNVLAAASGKVETVAYQKNGFGNYIVILQNDGNRSLYGHLKSVSVKTGQSVTQGSKIGVMGSTGNSSGVHLHFEIQKGNPMDTFRTASVASKLRIGTNVYKANNKMRNSYKCCATTADWIINNYKVSSGWYVHK
jgi:murein DD-endopeptidase MepM/ murein hydrolase activator NlpD